MGQAAGAKVAVPRLTNCGPAFPFFATNTHSGPLGGGGVPLALSPPYPPPPSSRSEPSVPLPRIPPAPLPLCFIAVASTSGLVRCSPEGRARGPRSAGPPVGLNWICRLVLPGGRTWSPLKEGVVLKRVDGGLGVHPLGLGGEGGSAPPAPPSFSLGGGGADMRCSVSGGSPPQKRGWGGFWHKASVSDCLPLAAPIGLSPLHILTLRGPERV